MSSAKAAKSTGQARGRVNIRQSPRQLRRLLYATIVCFCSTIHLSAAANSPSIRSLRVEPASVEIRGTNRSQRLLVTAEDTNGRLFDVSHRVLSESRNTAVCRIDAGIAIGVADGDTDIRMTCDGIETVVPVHVREFTTDPPVDFASDLLPLFSKLGCNSGGCHGKASGQNGFKLSVFGFDAAADFDALVKEGRGRRLFAANPESSLMLRKATGLVPHGGGQRMKPGSADYQVLESWIRQGTPFEQKGSPTLVSLVVSPVDRVLGSDAQQQILATAHFSDGSKRDVTDASSYVTNASLVADVDRLGLVRTGRVPGEAAITVHYMGQVASFQLQVPRSTPATPFEFPAQNVIDERVVEKLRKMQIVPSSLADDATFLRRISIDTIGTLPTSDEVREFLTDSGADKRSRWIDRLLDRPEYSDYWALIWSDILLVDRRKLGERGAYELHRWLRDQFAGNRPYDQWVGELITATGNSGTNGPANLFRAVETPEEMARTVSQAFLGVRMECAQCHHHPFEKWSQDDFYGLVGFFNGLERKPIASGRVVVYHAGLRETRVPLSNKLVPTRPLDGVVFSDPTSDPRRTLARWMVARENPWFARLVANRLWKHFLGRGLVEPEDDMRSTNPATNDPLLNLLADHLVVAKYDLKELMRLIANSRTYQLSSQTNPTNRDDEQNFSHHYVRRLPAEVLLDAIGSVTGVAETFPGRPPGTRAIELWDNRLPSYFLEIFGRPERTSPCECGRSSEPTMSQALHLMNAPEVESKISSLNGRVAKLTAAISSDDALIEELCLTALARAPRESETQIAVKLFAASPRQQAAEDFLWSLLNSYDFLFVK